MKTLSLVLAAVLVSSANSIACEDGWVAILGKCFRFHQELVMPWAEAMTLCKDEGSELAVIADSDSHRGVYEYILTFGLSGTFWLGGSDQAFEGDWKWVNTEKRIEHGTPFWALHSSLLGWSHEPSGGIEENCLALDSARRYYFNDHDCLLMHHPICMK